MQLRRILPTRGLALVALAAVVVALTVSQPIGRDGASAADPNLLSLNAHGVGVICDGQESFVKDAVAKPRKCTVPIGSSLTVSVEVNKLPPSGGYVGVQTQINYSDLTFDPTLSEDGAGANTCSDGIDNDPAVTDGVDNDDDGLIDEPDEGDGADEADHDCHTAAYEYKPTANEGDEMVWPDAFTYGTDPVKTFAARNTRVAGQVEHSSMTSSGPPFPVSTHIGNIVEITLNPCTATPSIDVIELVPLEPNNSSASGLRDSTGTLIPASDSLFINCDAESVIDSDGDGCSDARELQPKANVTSGGGRNPFWYWDFFDTPNADGVYDKVVNIFDVFRVADRFLANDAGAAGTTADPDRNTDPRTVLTEANGGPGPTDYHPGFDHSDPVGKNSWEDGAPDGTINIFDVFRVAAQYLNNCN